LGHFRLFRYWMNFCAKWAELEQLMHKYMQQSRIKIFQNECTWSTPLDRQIHILGI
jgi:hypothetical protein